MEKYEFFNYHSSTFKTDPVFGTSDFDFFGNPSKGRSEPCLFYIYLNSKRFAYCLVNPIEVITNQELQLKIKRYILNHEKNKDHDELMNTYFIGDLQKSIDVSSDFTNQNIILVTYSMIEQWYPKTLNQIFKNIINYMLVEQKFIGQIQQFYSINDDALFVDPTLTELEKRDYKAFLKNSMINEGLISEVKNGLSIDSVVLTSKAIDSVENVGDSGNKTAFIALKFDGNGERINAIQNAIAEAGYEPKVMTDVETNNWIMPEIFFQIEQSRFVVADFSLKCDGAYYEAGYAAALKKPVIHLFDEREKTDTNQLHFDIAQKSTIFYKDYDDLKTRLIRRIKATVK